MHLRYSALAVVVMLAWAGIWLSAQGGEVAIDSDDIGGVVTSGNGPEAGVWVIAETTDLPTKFARIVVTDNQGRYVVPDLPDARYDLFVRGYGLEDSVRSTARPGQRLNLDAPVAPDARSAAQVYPAAWWLNMITPPADEEAQLEFALTMKQCYDCHQVGNKATREILPAMRGRSGSSLDVWTRRTGVGPSGPGMAGQFRALGDMRQALADWTDRVAVGEAPREPPPRPAGVERNLVITLWDWGSEVDGRTDMAAADIRDGTVNANGPVFGVAEMTDSLTILDPVAHRASVVKVPSEASVVVQGFNASPTRSPHYGESVWARRADVRSSAVDATGRVWMASRLRDPEQQPDFCTSAENAFGAYFPLERASRQVSVYDPSTGEWGQIDTCFSADHNQMSDDNFLYFGQTARLAGSTWTSGTRHTTPRPRRGGARRSSTPRATDGSPSEPSRTRRWLPGWTTEWASVAIRWPSVTATAPSGVPGSAAGTGVSCGSRRARTHRKHAVPSTTNRHRAWTRTSSGREASRSTAPASPGRTGGSAVTFRASTERCATQRVTRRLPGRAVRKGGPTGERTIPPTGTVSSMPTRATWRTWTSTTHWGSARTLRSTVR